MNREETIEFLDDEETEERIFTLKYKIETTTEKLEELKRELKERQRRRYNERVFFM